jgi:hypothetical protein
MAIDSIREASPEFPLNIIRTGDISEQSMNIQAAIMTDKPDPFAHPSPTEFDYKPLLLALRECRLRLVEFMAKSGQRNPVYVEGESLIAYIDAVARLTRVPGAVKFVTGKASDLKG